MKFSAGWLPEVRPYHAGDREILAAVINDLCAEGRWMRTARFEPTPAWEHALTEPHCPCHLLLVACDGPYLIGWCRVFPMGAPGEAEVGIGLLPSHRSRGIGTRMLQQAVGWARRQHLTRLMLTTRADNRQALHVFEKCGFSLTGHREEMWLEMECALS